VRGGNKREGEPIRGFEKNAATGGGLDEEPLFTIPLPGLLLTALEEED